MERHLHIISFDVPYPPDYSGAADVFYTIRALHQAGVKIHLHCFEYGRGKQPELETYCVSVQYYPRLGGHKCVSPNLPYIVASRSNAELLQNLLKDDHPILAQGIHCTYLLTDPRFAGRKIIVRLFNTEYTYYQHLYKSTPVTSLFRKLYYRHESKMLKQYEQQIAAKVLFLALSEQDVVRYRQELQAPKITCLPPMLPYNEVTAKEGIGCFCLYHGNLSVMENEKAALWLLQKVFNNLKVPLVIAGKDPSPKLERIAQQHPHACLVANPTEQEMQDLIGQAQIHVLPSRYNKPVHIKLLNALFNGRHCIVNDEMIKDSVLAPTCHVATTSEAFKSVIIQLYHHPFEEHEIKLRKHLLSSYYNTAKNTSLLVSVIWR